MVRVHRLSHHDFARVAGTSWVSTSTHCGIPSLLQRKGMVGSGAHSAFSPKVQIAAAMGLTPIENASRSLHCAGGD